MSETPEDKANFMLTQQHFAYNVAPVGTWAQRWVPGFCDHELIRCTHGDEIIARNYRRRVCLICNRSFKGPVPSKCFFTGESHTIGDKP